MTSRRFTLATLLATACVIASFVTFNVVMNEFGMHGDATGKEWRVTAYNRASKYLFSLNYIPANFDGILIGSSSAANMLDTRKIKGAKLYNLAMNGANVCEVAPAAINALTLGSMKYLVIGLDPYFTKNSMMKTAELSLNLEKSTYGSLFTVRWYLQKFRNAANPTQDPYRESWWGHRLLDPTERQETLAAPAKESAYVIDEKAVGCLQQIIDVAHEKGVAVYAYFHPRHHDYIELNAANYADFETAMRAVFGPNDTVWNFNTPEYDALTKTPAMFHDNVHLTQQGADVVMQEIERRIAAQ